MGLYNPNPSGVVHRPFSDRCYCIFDVLDAGVWYRIDTTCLRPEFYADVPEDVIRRADRKKWEAVMGTKAGNYRVNPAPYFEAALREEFDDVRFLGTDFVPGMVY